MSLFKKIYLVAGGTGGHIFPAYSLTKYFLKKNIKTKIITDERGVRFLKNYPGLQLKIIKLKRLWCGVLVNSTTLVMTLPM